MDNKSPLTRDTFGVSQVKSVDTDTQKKINVN